jgi:hypothetical protein
LRTLASFLHWNQFCSMIFSRFATHSAHSSLENIHHLKQTSSVIHYIQKFEEMMALMQMDYPGLTKQYFVSTFIAGLRDGIKHYLIPHNPQTLSDTYWKAKELEKGILVKKSLLTSSTTYPRTSPPNASTTQTKPLYHNQIAHPNSHNQTSKTTHHLLNNYLSNTGNLASIGATRNHGPLSTNSFANFERQSMLWLLVLKTS